MPLDIFIYYYINIYVYVLHFMTSPLWLAIGPQFQCGRLFRMFQMCVLLIAQLSRIVKGWVPINRFNHTSWIVLDTSTDRPKSVRNCCVIEIFGGVLVLSIYVLNVLLVKRLFT